MKSNGLISVILAIAAAWAAGCAKSQQLSPDTETDTDTATAADTDSDADSDADSDTDSDADSDTDTDTDADTDTSSDTDTPLDSDTGGTKVDQTPIEIRVSNRSQATIYLNGYSPVTGEWAAGNNWASFQMKAPGCSLACDDVQNPDQCCIDCVMMMFSYAILPGDTLAFSWDGQIYKTDMDTCHCGCYYSEPPVAGDYRFVVNAYPSADCLNGVCDAPVESGVVDFGSPVGVARTFSVDFAVPYTGDTIEIEIPRDAHCDDDTLPVCASLPPACDPLTEVLAFRDNCFQCVNSETCQP